jgi:metal-responsive CopG/Arc/MetJ family transcriptional regulator
MHMGMRSTVTIRDDLFEAADRVAARLGISRSRLYQIALEAYLRRLEEFGRCRRAPSPGSTRGFAW